MTDFAASAIASSQPDLVQRRADRLALTAAESRLTAKLQQLAELAGISPLQLDQASLERFADAFRSPSSNAQRFDAYEVATRLIESLPAHAGTALATRAELAIFLLDPGGAVRLTMDLRLARHVLDGEPGSRAD